MRLISNTRTCFVEVYLVSTSIVRYLLQLELEKILYKLQKSKKLKNIEVHLPTGRGRRTWKKM